MVKKDTLAVFLVGACIVLPATFSLAAYMITKNPNLRPLAVTIERLADAGLISGSAKVIAEVSISKNSPLSVSQDDYEQALKLAFDRFQTEVRVRFKVAPTTGETSVTYIVGESRIGPYPIAQAAAGIRAATQAQRMIVAQQDAEELERARLRQGKWYRIFD